MTTKTTKTIVFAAMIAAMILPFGGMQSAYAVGEHLPENAVRDGSHGPPTADQTVDTTAELADKLANLENTLAFINQELINCSDPSVLAALDELKVIVEAAIDEIVNA